VQAGPQKIWRPTGSLASRMRTLVGFTAVAAVLAGALLSSLYVFLYSSDRLAHETRALAHPHRATAAKAALYSDASAAQKVADLLAAASPGTAVEITNARGYSLARSGSTAGLALLPKVRVTLPLETDYLPVGTLQLATSRRPALTAMLWLLPVQLLALAIAVGFALLATGRLRSTTVRPIQGLIETMEHVARDKDYGVKAQPDGPDEIGILINSFNDMLNQIRERDEHLAEHRQQLQEQVAERTRKLEEAAHEAEHSSRAKGDFLARMSHEIRTPMNGVVGMAELLQNTPLDERQLRMLQTMRRSADALLEIINDILDFSKIEAGRLQVVREDFGLVELVEEVCELLAPKAQERGLELVCDVDGSVPAFAGGDPIRLRQVVVNLLGNAVKYTEQGHVVVRARNVAEDGVPLRLRVEVEDTGLGIPEEEIETVFEAFTQVDSFETRKHGGTGLGLAITRQLVGILGGEVGVTSKVGQGSTFWFELPLEAAARPPHRDPWSLPETRVLLVQPNAPAAEAVRTLLERAGATVVTVATGQRALEKLALDGPYGLAIVDRTLPDMDGNEFLERFGSSGLAAVPVVMLTPVVASGRATPVTTCEPDEWLAKPVRRQRLAETVERALGLAGPATPNSNEPAPASTLRELGLKVLLVEDSPVNVEVAKGMLEALGCEVVAAGDGTLGVEYALGSHFDVVLMDCQMPLMDGYEATRKIRASESTNGRPPVPIVAITANALPGDRERCLESGMTDFISKPFTIRKLQAVMQAVTGAAGRVAASGTGAAGDDHAATHPVIEVGQIEELRAIGRPQVVRQAILLFLKQAAQKLDELHAGLGNGNLEAVAFAAHALKSSALSIGGRRFASVASDCEAAARGGDAEAAERSARRLRPEFRALCKGLSSLVQAEERAA
jgi:two-component system sensor histidine kinase/response regulator